MTSCQIVQEIEAAGGVLVLEGDQIRCNIPRSARALVEAARPLREEIRALLQQRLESAPVPKRVRIFPHCPRCGGFYLYRKNKTGNYECQTCHLGEITEGVARSPHRA